MAAVAPWSLVTLLGLTFPVMAQDCRLALVLALDVSSSVDAVEDRLQRDGLARALLAPEVIRAFLTGEPVALFAFEWSSPSYQMDLTPGWQIIDTEEDLVRVAAALGIGEEVGESRQKPAGTTGLGTALVYAAGVLSSGPPCAAQTVDISGDGENNEGVRPEVLYRTPLFDDVTVNALIVDRLRIKHIPPEEIDLVAWFDAHVLHGPGAFWIVAEDYEDYERAMKVKLLRELGMPIVGEGSATGLQSPS
ncbi:DUF1194 domain-containing protein [Rubellimicrobium rubrum]|uniref:DUF1194 domain-containing protein n=1 Tax=Rubellimicrobium rubrum TaxID=2585369 RepID=A0A5C4N5M6_9RHOB|nr:DUF1194 domain-containing protein [Rubellimicrobium rubrum]TNC53023.1 DUF1194 domain-containing protein [Rubellimicrobium rubrum]